MPSRSTALGASVAAEIAWWVPLSLGGDDTEYKRGKLSQPLGAFLTAEILGTEGKGCCRRQCDWGGMNYSRRKLEPTCLQKTLLETNNRNLPRKGIEKKNSSYTAVALGLSPAISLSL